MKIFKNIRGISYNSPVILTFALISLAVLVIANITGSGVMRLLFSVHGNSWSWTDPFAYFRLIGHIFGHADFSHYTGNFIMILLIGPVLEEKYGSRRMTEMIFTTALITGLIFTIFIPNIALRGASGIVFTLILLSSFTNARTGKIPLTLIFAVIIYIGREVIAGMANATGITSDNISQLGHIIGAVCGLVFGIILNVTERNK